MEKKRTIVCIGTPTWEGNYAKSTVQLLSELSDRYTILYVDYQYTVKDMIMTAAGRQNAPLRRMAGLDERLRKLPAGNSGSVFVLTPPPIIPMNWINDRKIYNAVQSFNARIIRSSILSAMQELKMEDPIVISAFNPSFGMALKGTLGESSLIYYCYDNISAAPWLGKHGGMLEQEFAAAADVIVTSSDELTKRFSNFSTKVHVVKNGVDFQNMQRGFSEVRRYGRPVAGYIGSIDERIDYDLLESVIDRSQDITFRFIGRSTHPNFEQRLRRHSNVEMLGAHPSSSLPDFLKEMDVCIIPFAMNEFNRSVYPMKVNEYLAAGKPVVMTPFADLPEFSGIVRCSDSAENFNRSLRNEIANDTAEQKDLRQTFAHERSWTNRAKEFSTVIETAVRRRTGGTK